jgi:hypothetical protein
MRAGMELRGERRDTRGGSRSADGREENECERCLQEHGGTSWFFRHEVGARPQPVLSAFVREITFSSETGAQTLLH